MPSKTALAILGLVVLSVALAFPSILTALVPPDDASNLPDEYLDPILRIQDAAVALHRLPAEVAAPRHDDLADLGIASEYARLDLRTGRWATLLLARPLLPGTGVGNKLTWNALDRKRPTEDAQLVEEAWGAFLGYLERHQEALRIDPRELSPEFRVAIHEEGRLIQIHAPRRIGGVPVRGSFVSAVIRQGNLILFGTERWGDLDISRQPSISEAEAWKALSRFLRPLEIRESRQASELLLIPTGRESSMGSESQGGQGLDHRLVWALRIDVEASPGPWEALVDAHRGEVLALQDTTHYALDPERHVEGGVLPLTNDGTPPEGVEQAGWPMPFSRVSTPVGNMVTDSGGQLPTGIPPGSISSRLRGPYVRVRDDCGPIELQSTGDLDFGTHSGTDCTTPGFGGAGNTRAARTNFFELNRLMEMARSHLPNNLWLQSLLDSNTNELWSFCNASWSSTAGLNFHRSASGPNGCANTGELATVIAHEWGHGMDDNDANGFISNPGEGIADLFAALRHNTSCIGRGYKSTNCLGYGGASCNQCTGVREIDWDKTSGSTPHDVSWAMTHCGTNVHCRGLVVAETGWDLLQRDLQNSPYHMDLNTALEVTTRLTFLGSGAVSTWYQDVTPNGGCQAGGGFLNFLAADDDNGDLTDGTPHMRGIFQAFARHGIACNTPGVADFGCSPTPTTAPAVQATPGDRSVHLTWPAIPMATEYEIFRTDGVAGCDLGKVKAGTTTGLSFTDTGLRNGRDYSYVVIPKGPSESCFGPASPCVTVTPAAPPPPNCCNIPLRSQSFHLVSPSGLAVSDTSFAFCALAGAQAAIGGVCDVQHNVATSSWQLSAPNPNTGCHFRCIEQGPHCPCAPFSEEFQLNGTQSQTLNPTDYAYCALAGILHAPSGSCLATYHPGNQTWHLSSNAAACRFACIPTGSACVHFAFDEFRVQAPGTQSVQVANYAYCALSGVDHDHASHCWIDLNAAAGTWELQANGSSADCRFTCIHN